MRSILPLCALMLVSCAGVIDGTIENRERIRLSSTPAGATVIANGFAICQTPCSARLTNAQMRSLVIRLDGYHTARLKPAGQLAGATAGNIIAGGFVGLSLDIVSGRLTAHEDAIHVELFQEDQ